MGIEQRLVRLETTTAADGGRPAWVDQLLATATLDELRDVRDTLRDGNEAAVASLVATLTEQDARWAEFFAFTPTRGDGVARNGS